MVFLLTFKDDFKRISVAHPVVMDNGYTEIIEPTVEQANVQENS